MPSTSAFSINSLRTFRRSFFETLTPCVETNVPAPCRLYMTPSISKSR